MTIALEKKTKHYKDVAQKLKLNNFVVCWLRKFSMPLVFIPRSYFSGIWRV